jgi:hypothetical protein
MMKEVGQVFFNIIYKKLHEPIHQGKLKTDGRIETVLEAVKFIYPDFRDHPDHKDNCRYIYSKIIKRFR